MAEWRNANGALCVGLLPAERIEESKGEVTEPVTEPEETPVPEEETDTPEEPEESKGEVTEPVTEQKPKRGRQPKK